jgi:hypothetical protein
MASYSEKLKKKFDCKNFGKMRKIIINLIEMKKKLLKLKYYFKEMGGFCFQMGYQTKRSSILQQVS